MRLLAMSLLLPATLTAAEPKKEAGPANRLAKESSPYLLQHAHNPVDWYPWCPEAFEKAKKEKKLIFLSIGYSSCHWCHVMERESFEDKEVAALLNKNFVAIKVDREERPDVDEVYMTALQVIDGRGGWPLSMFLTDEGKPIVGGTYWPKEDRKVDEGVARGFKSILSYMVELNTDKGKELRAQADHVAERTEEAMTRAARGIAIVELTKALAMGPVEELKDRLDDVHGGIGSKETRFRGTKFPMPASLAALMRASKRDKDADLAKLVTLTLTKMAEGGIYDQLGGGFHRYSTERTWTVPHFEKMLYDNAQLVELYSEAYRDDPKPLYKRVVDETVRFVQREMTSPEGAFYSALDADSEGKEGEFYVWTAEEIEKALGDKDAPIFRAAYSVSGQPTFEEKQYVLKLSRPLADVAKDQKMTEDELRDKLASLRTKLFDIRAKRPRPFLDTKVLTAWNGQMIAGLAAAGQTFKQPEYTKAATRAAEFVLANLKTKDGRLLRTYGISEGRGQAKLTAYLDDYSFLIHGLLCLHDATHDGRWLIEAKGLMDATSKWYGDGDHGGFFFTASDGEKLFARAKDYHDGVQPSGNSVAANNLVRLWKKTGDESYRKQAEKTIKQFAGILKGNPASVPAMGEALHLFVEAGGKKADPKPEEKKEASKRITSEDVVHATANLGPADKDGKRALTVTLKIDKPWHVYANPVDNDDLEGARTTVDVHADGKKLPAKIDFPKGKIEKDEKGVEYKVFEGEIAIAGTVTSKDATDLEVRIKVQACTSGANGRCLQSATLKIPVK
ncbi:MAG TPA: DUF255 domain-containing protein [Gemmataceae bacterium]|jgi:hypothetical protein|nr:DUF255 domain-containing protein [Gemmataceae bacterium]